MRQNLEHHGPRVYFVGSDYIYPHESNRAMRHILRTAGGEVVGEDYVPLDCAPDTFDAVIARIFETRPDAIFSTVVGEDSCHFYRAFHRLGGRGTDLPIASLTTNEAEIARTGPLVMAGHLTAAPYFSTLQSPRNTLFLDRYRRRFGTTEDVTSCGEASYSQIHFFAMALRECGLLDTDALRGALLGKSFDAPQGRVTIDPDNQHTYLYSRIARVDATGAYAIEQEAPTVIKPDPYLVTPAATGLNLSLRSRKISLT